MPISGPKASDASKTTTGRVAPPPVRSNPLKMENSQCTPKKPNLFSLRNFKSG